MSFVEISCLWLAQKSNNIRVSLFMGGDEYDSGIADKGSVSFDDLEEGKYLVMINDS